jgi:DNA ligase-1
MDYFILAETCEKLEGISSKLSKTEVLAEMLKNTHIEYLPKLVLLVQGIVFPHFSGNELGIATQMMIKAISKASGFKEESIEEKFRKTGDLGLVAEEVMKSKKQTTLLKKRLTIDFVFHNLQELAFITGSGSQEKKLKLIAELLVSAKPKEAKYIVRTILGELRVGTAEGIIRDAIVKAFLFKEDMTKEEKKESTFAVDYAYNIFSDFGEIARIAKEKGLPGLKRAKVQLGNPIQVMLGEKAESIKDIVEDFGEIAAEYKYDGMRAQIHKKGNEIWIFTRRLEDVKKQFPDLVELCNNGLTARECIVEGEVLGMNTKTNEPLPFQQLSQRIQRKYDIEEMTKEIPIQMNLFDVIYLNGEMLVDKGFSERRKILEKIVKTIPKKFQLAKQIVSGDGKKLEKFYKEALKAKQEGLFLKVLDSKYVFGRHVDGWYKIKPIMESLDLIIIGATWGEGTRAKWLSSFVVAVRDINTGNFLECGMMSTGFTEEEYENMTKTLTPLILRSEGRNVEIKPKIVVEVGYQEIQKSPTYASGFALRFPRLIRIRPDKGIDDADTLERLEELFKSRGRAG